jgi:hypothetical protein
MQREASEAPCAATDGLSLCRVIACIGADGSLKDTAAKKVCIEGGFAQI